jgi:tRNA(adenine34) deaminase
MKAMLSDSKYMQMALEEAQKALKGGDVPVGAVLVDFKGRVIGRGYNMREQCSNPVLHAEIIALCQGSMALNSWRLDNTTLFVTLEPCSMCAGALVNSRVSSLVFGACDLKAGAVVSRFGICTDSSLNHTLKVRFGIMQQECSSILVDFFKSKRI